MHHPQVLYLYLSRAQRRTRLQATRHSRRGRTCSNLARRSAPPGPGTRATALCSAFSSARLEWRLLRVSGAKHGFPYRSSAAARARTRRVSLYSSSRPAGVGASFALAGDNACGLNGRLCWAASRRAAGETGPCGRVSQRAL
jgi:hypothetical protein